MNSFMKEKIARGESLLKKIIVLWIVIDVIFLLLKLLLYGFILSALVQTVVRVGLIIFLGAYICKGYMMARNCTLVLIAGNFVMSLYNIAIYVANLNVMLGNTLLIMVMILTAITVLFYAAAFMSIMRSDDIRAYIAHKETQRTRI